MQQPTITALFYTIADAITDEQITLIWDRDAEKKVKNELLKKKHIITPSHQNQLEITTSQHDCYIANTENILKFPPFNNSEFQTKLQQKIQQDKTFINFIVIDLDKQGKTIVSIAHLARTT